MQCIYGIACIWVRGRRLVGPVRKNSTMRTVSYWKKTVEIGKAETVRILELETTCGSSAWLVQKTSFSFSLLIYIGSALHSRPLTGLMPCSAVFDQPLTADTQIMLHIQIRLLFLVSICPLSEATKITAVYFRPQFDSSHHDSAGKLMHFDEMCHKGTANLRSLPQKDAFGWEGVFTGIENVYW